MNFNELFQTSGEWLRGGGPENDIVICSRIRLARNLADFPFSTRASRADRADIQEQIQRAIGHIPLGLIYQELTNLGGLDLHVLVERQLISRELRDGDGPRGVAVGPRENVSIMVNEEDHLRIQVMQAGLNLADTWEQINDLDDRLEEHLVYAYSRELGYLTACPTNVGCGIRVGVLMHLPGLVQTKEIDKVFQALQKINLAVRGLYGEGTQASGDFYQISNQQTLGKSENELIRNLNDVIPQIIQYERAAREKLANDASQHLRDQVSRAYGVLKTAHTITSEETMLLLSNVRLGINLGLIGDLDIRTVNELFIHTQPAHLQKRRGEMLEKEQRNIARAEYLRERLTNGTNGSEKDHDPNSSQA